jgi:hypothetical protein
MKKIIEFIRKYPEVLAIPIALIVWKLSVYVLRFLDPTSGVYDAGVFQIPIFAVIQFFVFVSIAWLTMKILYGTLRRFLQIDFKEEFLKLDRWQKIKLAYGVFFGLVFLLAYLSQTLK